MAGQAAAEYVKELAEREKYAGKTDTETSALGDREEVPMSEGHQSLVRLSAENGVRYTVPQYLDPKHMKDQIIVRFRVDNVYKNRSISVYYDGVRIQTRKKRVMAPGEMEQVILKKEELQKYPDLKEIVMDKRREEMLQKWILNKQKHTYVRIDPNWQKCDFKYPGWVRND